MADVMLRVANIMQYEYNPTTLETLLTEERIKAVLSMYASIKQWAYIRHDKDVYSAEDAEKEANKARGIKAGDVKPPHWHIVLSIPNKVKLSAVASWFGIASQYIEIPRGRNAFAHCVAYLDHRFQPDKHQYSSTDVQANFDWQNLVATLALDGGGKKLVDRWLVEISKHGKTIKECYAANPAVAVSYAAQLNRARAWYLRHEAPMPPLRTNILITGVGGCGKTVFARALALALCDPSCASDPEDIIFMLGDRNSGFSSYDGQPVIIWDDSRVVGKHGLLQRYGRETLLRIMDVHPARHSTDIKYSETCLINVYNIFTTPGDAKTWIESLVDREYDGLAQSWTMKEDVGQAYRRIPIIFTISAEQVEMIVNERYYSGDNSVAWSSLQHYATIRGNIGRLMAHKTVVGEACAQAALRRMATAVSAHMAELPDGGQSAEYTDTEVEELRSEFDNYGKASDVNIPF